MDLGNIKILVDVLVFFVIWNLQLLKKKFFFENF